METPGIAVLPIDRFGSDPAREHATPSCSSKPTARARSSAASAASSSCRPRTRTSFRRSPIHRGQNSPSCPARLLRELIRRTLFATDNESSRYALGGVLLEFERQQDHAVGTDGRRLAKMEGPAHSVGGHQTGDNTTIVPTRAMQLIERALTDGDAEVQLAARGNDILVQQPAGHDLLAAGRRPLPKWRDVFPQRRDAAKIELPVGPFYSAVRQAAIVTSEESRGVDFTFADGTLRARGPRRRSGPVARRAADRLRRPADQITLDPRFVSDFLKVLDPEKTFTLELKDADSAAVCSTDDGYGYVIMPLARDR